MHIKKALSLGITPAVQPGDSLLTTAEFRDRFKVSIPSQWRHRKNGDGPPFINYNGKILYPESGVIAWLNAHMKHSSAEIPTETRGGRYLHLPLARLKAQELRKQPQARTKTSTIPDQETHENLYEQPRTK